MSTQPTASNNQSTPLNADAGVPPNLVLAGVVVGLALIFLGIWFLYLGRASLLSNLMTCVGFGIVLASFGSRAGGAWAGWTATGSGALAIILFLLLQHYTPSLSSSFYKKGQLRGDLSRIADIRIIDEYPMYQYRDRNTSSFRFILLERRLRSPRISVQVDTTEKGAGKEFFELIGDAQFIQKHYLSLDESSMDTLIQWTFDYDRRVIKDGEQVIFSEQDSLQERLIPNKSAKSSPGAFDLLATKAYADDLNWVQPAAEGLIKQLVGTSIYPISGARLSG